MRDTFFSEFHHPGLMGIRMRDRLRTELKADAGNRSPKISPIIDKTAAQLAEIRKRDRASCSRESSSGHTAKWPLISTDDQRLKLQRKSKRVIAIGSDFAIPGPRPSASPESSAQPP